MNLISDSGKWRILARHISLDYSLSFSVTTMAVQPHLATVQLPLLLYSVLHAAPHRDAYLIG